MYNFYASPDLCKYLFSNGFGSCVSVPLDRKGIPAWYRKAALKKGDIVTYDDAPVMRVKWHDKRVLTHNTIPNDGGGQQSQNDGGGRRWPAKSYKSHNVLRNKQLHGRCE